jgi:hypothetical protein
MGRERDDELYWRIRDYIYDNGASPALVIARALGVDVTEVIRVTGSRFSLAESSDRREARAPVARRHR